MGGRGGHTDTDPGRGKGRGGSAAAIICYFPGVFLPRSFADDEEIKSRDDLIFATKIAAAYENLFITDSPFIFARQFTYVPGPLLVSFN